VSPDLVRAAGGVVRRELDGRSELAVVHRPRYDDWTIPKGKLEPGEDDAEGALREVMEETGFLCELGEELTASRYVDHLGRPKIVRYWLMTPISGAFRPNAEVDRLRWLGHDEALSLLTYDRDRELVRGLLPRG
jgi:8-oxo-dGTP diphosphatase